MTTKKQPVSNTFAEVKWTAADVQSLRPKWSLEKCEDWLASEERHIENRVTELGWEVIECLLP